MAATANAINYLSENKPLPLSSYNPISYDSPYAFLPGGVGYNNRFMSPKLPWKGKDGADLYLDLVGQADTALRWILDTPGALTARYNVAIRAAANQAKGEAFGGRKLETPAERGMQLATDLVMPIGAGNVAEALRQASPGAAPFIPPGEARLGITGSLLQTSGLNIRSETLADMKTRLAREKGLLKPGETLENKPLLNKQMDREPEIISYRRAQGKTAANEEFEVKLAEFNALRARSADLGIFTGTGWSNAKRPDPANPGKFLAYPVKAWREDLADMYAAKATAQATRDRIKGPWKDKEPEGPEGKALWDYYKLMDKFQPDERGKRDIPGLAQAQDEYLAGLSPELEKYVLDNLGVNEDSLAQEFRRDKRVISETFWKPMRAAQNSKLEYIRNLVFIAKAQGNTQVADRLTAQYRLNAYEDGLRAKSLALRTRNGVLDVLLVKWGYFINPAHPGNRRRMRGG